jgi:DNA helicase-2/ATP-dependent DNA helicase PcrA
MRSRFIDELPEEHVEFVAELGLQPAATRAEDLNWSANWTVAVPAANAGGPSTLRQAQGSGAAFLTSAPPLRRAQELNKKGGFAVGDRVFNQKFGYGVVTAVEDGKLSVHFDDAGDKKVMDAFVERA